ncbi:MAG: V-type ATP synthase subunit E family protein, partial [Myxococcota bacterium]|nr:V-type ATP synthase subunit E family protein [Myxococcota bacterium]
MKKPRRGAIPRGDPPDDAGLTPILDGVAEDAQREREHLLEEAHRRAAERLEEADREAEAIVERAERDGAAEGEREARRKTALAEIEARQGLLRLRESFLERTLEEAARRLARHLQGEAGAALVADWIRAAARELGETSPRVRIHSIDRGALEAALAGSELAVCLENPDSASSPGAVVATADGRREVDATL